MSYGDDLIQAIDARIKVLVPGPISFVGVVTSLSPLLAIVDGSTVPIPCLVLDNVTLEESRRVVINKYGSQFVILGMLITS